MWFKHRVWIFVSWLLSLVNLGAVWFAALPAEPWHAAGHALLAVLFGLGAQHLAARKKIAAASDVVERLRELESRLANPDPHSVGQALDAIAVEVERIGEGQRFLTKLFAEQDAQSAERAGAPKPSAAIRSSTPRNG